MEKLSSGGWAPVRKTGRESENDWVNLRQAYGLRVVNEGGRYLIAADYPNGLVLTDLVEPTAEWKAVEALRRLVEELR
ncbi:hypothetical protein ACPFP2_17865 [Micromonospora citrea]|uniref:hypothetical protein n=1 Tax=Micromonospora citrea TaxID=47855 RepID=UPI003C6ACB74